MTPRLLGLAFMFDLVGYALISVGYSTITSALGVVSGDQQD